MIFEELRPEHFREWGMDFEPDDAVFCGFAARNADGALAVICCCYADDGKWIASFARRGGYPASVHREMIKAVLALRSAGVTEIWANADPLVPRSREFLEYFGFKPTGNGSEYCKRFSRMH